MSLEEISSVAKNKPEECPGAALHEDDGEKWIAVDDITGQQLDPKLMKLARKDEIAYFKEMGVYEKVSRRRSTGRQKKRDGQSAQSPRRASQQEQIENGRIMKSETSHLSSTMTTRY